MWVPKIPMFVMKERYGVGQTQTGLDNWQDTSRVHLVRVKYRGHGFHYIVL